MATPARRRRRRARGRRRAACAWAHRARSRRRRRCTARAGRSRPCDRRGRSRRTSRARRRRLRRAPRHRPARPSPAAATQASARASARAWARASDRVWARRASCQSRRRRGGSLWPSTNRSCCSTGSPLLGTTRSLWTPGSTATAVPSKLSSSGSPVEFHLHVEDVGAGRGILPHGHDDRRQLGLDLGDERGAVLLHHAGAGLVRADEQLLRAARRCFSFFDSTRRPTRPRRRPCRGPRSPPRLRSRARRRGGR